MNGVIYCRVSSKEQTEGTSLESQEIACRDFAHAEKINVLKIFVERGESAKFADRTQLLELIEFCRKNKGRIEVLIVWKIDRFSRNVADHFSIKATLAKYGVRIVSVTEPIDSKPEGKLMETILAGFAQFDNDIRAMRVVQGMRRKIEQGIFPWKAPLGYVSSTEHGENKVDPDKPHPELFTKMQKVWKEFATGAYTKMDMQRLLVTLGATTAGGKTLSAQFVDRLFRNPYYAGILVDPWSGQEHKGRQTPMVSRAEFAQVQQVIAKRNRSMPHTKERPEFPLRGFVRCRHCRHPMTASFSRGGGGRYPYYHCHTAGCPLRSKSHPAVAVHDEFERFLDLVAPKSELAERMVEAVVTVAQKGFRLASENRSRVKSQLGAINGQTQELISMRTRGLISEDDFIAQKTVLTDRRSVLESAAIDFAPASPTLVQRQLREVMEPLVSLRQTWHELPVASQRRFQQLILPIGFVQDQIGTAQLGLLFRFFRDFSDGKSPEVDPVFASWNRLFMQIKGFLKLSQVYQGRKMRSK